MTKKQELFEALNGYLHVQGKAPLKSWKQSIQKLEERVAKERSAAAALSAKTTLQESGDIPGDDAEDTPADTHKKQGLKGALPTGKITVSSVCRKGFDDGLTNDQVHGLLMNAAKTKGLDYGDNKKWYITWYRSEFKRRAAKAKAKAEAKKNAE